MTVLFRPQQIKLDMSCSGMVEPASASSGDRITTIYDWIDVAQSGDFARAKYGPHHCEQAFYGQPIPPGKLFFLERLLSRGDAAIVQSFRRKLFLLPDETVLRIFGGRK